MEIGLYFGSFNPVHTGHMIVANFAAYNTELEKVWLIVSPQNPLKPSATLLNEYDRYHLVELAVNDEPRLKASNIEFGLPKPSYTVDTLTYLSEKFPEHRFSVIMGSDSLENLGRWKNHEHILENYPVYVYIRPRHDIGSIFHSRIKILDAPLLDISASFIRKLIRERKSVRYLLPDAVAEYIEANHYYRKLIS
jgi:nicotinate-nucleotide adenylyltransferase